MKYLLIISFFYTTNCLYAQVQEYLYVSDIKFEEFSPNPEFFVPVSSHNFEQNVNSGSLLMVINDTSNRIYYDIGLLYAFEREQSKVDSIENLVDPVLKSPSSDTLLFSRKENILVVKVRFLKKIKYL